MAELHLGCHWPPLYDKRNIKLSAIMPLRQLFVPREFDAEVDLLGRQFPARMWGNNREGCCVIAAQANWTRVLEHIEQGRLVNITDDDVHNEYRRQSNGADNGLYMLDAFNSWRNDGWHIAGGTLNKAKVPGCWRKIFPKPEPEKQHLNIHAFAALDSLDELRAAVYYLHGCNIAVRMYDEDFRQFEAGETWHVNGNPGEFRGGHCVYIPAFNTDGTIDCWTWGKRQKIDPEWLWNRQYDMYGVVDNRNAFIANSPVDVEKLEALLREIVNS
jgi:hypothetical protein